MDKKEIGESKILSIQPYSINATGGGSRILRRVIGEKNHSIIFLSIVEKKPLNNSNYSEELEVVLFPKSRKWHRSFVRTFAYFLRYRFFCKLNRWLIRKKVKHLEFDILHVVNQGPYTNALLQIAKERGISIWASFHDHFDSIGSSFNATKDLWLFSEKRMVISQEMGDLYNGLFENKEFVIVTDGLQQSEISEPKIEIPKTQVKIYFGGLLHIAYYPLFKSFGQALEIASTKLNVQFNLILRGTQKLDFLNEKIINVEYREVTIDNNELKVEMDECDILYLPIKYSDENFFKFSMSTKMVGYLGAPGNIFYHGPEIAAVSQLLIKYDAAVICDSLDPSIIFEKIEDVIKSTNYSKNAKDLANDQFLLKDKQILFWNK